MRRTQVQRQSEESSTWGRRCCWWRRGRRCRRVRLLEGQLYQGQGGRRAGVIQRYSVDDRMETMETMELMSMGGHQSSGGQTILTAAAKKQGLEALVLEQHDGGRVEVERIPELPHEQSQTVEIANVQDPETGATRQYIVTQMCDSTSAGKQNLETIVEAIRHLEGDHLFSEEAGPHQVVKEEVVESCIIDDPDMEIQMTLSSPPANYNTTSANIINSLPQVPVPVGQQYHLSALPPLHALRASQHWASPNQPRQPGAWAWKPTTPIGPRLSHSQPQLPPSPPCP